MSKICYFNVKFSKIAKRWGLFAHSCIPLKPDFDDLKLRDLLKLRFFKRIMTNSNFKNISYDVILVTSSLSRHQTNVHKIFQFWATPNQNFWLRQCAG